VLITILVYIGAFAFALGGSYRALEKQFDLFGICLCACVTAFGGGIIRDTILHKAPVFFTNPSLLIAVGLGVACAIAIYRWTKLFSHYITTVNALGLVIASLIGCQSAAAAGLGLPAMALFAFLGAAGGGIMTQVITGSKHMLYGDFYPALSILFACEFFLVRSYAHETLVQCILLGNVFLLRLFTAQIQTKMWRPHSLKRTQEETTPNVLVADQALPD